MAIGRSDSVYEPRYAFFRALGARPSRSGANRCAKRAVRPRTRRPSGTDHLPSCCRTETPRPRAPRPHVGSRASARTARRCGRRARRVRRRSPARSRAPRNTAKPSDRACLSSSSFAPTTSENTLSVQKDTRPSTSVRLSPSAFENASRSASLVRPASRSAFAKTSAFTKGSPSLSRYARWKVDFPAPFGPAKKTRTGRVAFAAATASRSEPVNAYAWWSCVSCQAYPTKARRYGPPCVRVSASHLRGSAR